jgi:hypothetical protein
VLVALLNTSKASTDISQRIRFSRFFIEAASLVLLFDLLRDPNTTSSSRSFMTVAEAIQCLLRIPVDKELLISANAISRMLDLTKELVSKNSHLTPSDVISPTSASGGTGETSRASGPHPLIPIPASDISNVEKGESSLRESLENTSLFEDGSNTFNDDILDELLFVD